MEMLMWCVTDRQHCVIWGFCHEVVENCALLGCYEWVVVMTEKSAVLKQHCLLLVFRVVKRYNCMLECFLFPLCGMQNILFLCRKTMFCCNIWGFHSTDIVDTVLLSNGGMILTGETEILEKTCPSTNLYTTNLKWTERRLNPALRGDRPSPELPSNSIVPLPRRYLILLFALTQDCCGGLEIRMFTVGPVLSWGSWTAAVLSVLLWAA